MKKEIITLVIIILIINIFLIHFVIASGPNTGQENGQGQELNIQNQQEIRSGNYTGENGQQIKIQQQLNNRISFEVGGINVNCSCNMTQEQIQNRTKLKVKLSNGRNAEIKIMPNTASETALQRLRLKNCNEEQECSIELKEIGSKNQTKIAYEIRARKQSKVFGLFKTKMNIQAQVNAETGEIQIKKPWWAFLAIELEE